MLFLLMFISSGSMLEAWQTYIAWEIEMGNINEARSLYKRCYSKRFPGTGSEVYFHVVLFILLILKITLQQPSLKKRKKKDTSPESQKRPLS